MLSVKILNHIYGKKFERIYEIFTENKAGSKMN
jgi:hypothetical protein